MSQLTRREKRMAERRDQILRAAAQKFAEKGFHNTTTKEIAEAADVAEGTIYNYFKNKDDLLIAMMNHLSESDDRQQVLQAGLDQDFESFFIQLVIDRMSRLKENIEFFMAILPEVVNDAKLREKYYIEFLAPAVNLMEQHLVARIERGQVEPVNDPKSLIHIYASTIIGMHFMRILNDPIIEDIWNDPESMAESLRQAFFVGITPKEES
jgi:AcrR family transcriptional regulator